MSKVKKYVAKYDTTMKHSIDIIYILLIQNNHGYQLSIHNTYDALYIVKYF